MKTLKPARPTPIAPSPRRLTLPPEFRRMYWHSSLVCLSIGTAWGYIALRTEARVAWRDHQISVLESWERAWSQGVIADSIAVGLGVVLGLELAHRCARFVLRHRVEDAGGAVPFPGRNAALTALYAGPALVLGVVMAGLLLGLMHDAPLPLRLLLPAYQLLFIAAIVSAPFEACHLTARWIAWDRRCRAAVRGAPWQDGPVTLFERSARDRAREALYPPRFAPLTVASALAATAGATFGALEVLAAAGTSMIERDMSRFAVRSFVVNYVGTFAACEVLHQVIRFFVWLYRFQHPDAATPRP